MLIPDARAGCSLADSITAEQLLAWKAEHPGAAVVAYVNSSAEVKALGRPLHLGQRGRDLAEFPAAREVLFLPDQFLARVRGASPGLLPWWAGECHVHAGISPQALRDMAAANPEAELFVHPECGCGTLGALQMGHRETCPQSGTLVLSTGGMLSAARSARSPACSSPTETGMLHQLRKANPAVRELGTVNPNATCHYMKMITPSAL